MKSKRILVQHLLVLVCLLVSGVMGSPTLHAQEVNTLIIDDVDVSDWPTVRAYVTIADLDGDPVLGLTASDFELYENDLQRPIGEIITSTQDMLLTIVIDSSSSLRREERGKSRLDHAKDAAIRLLVNNRPGEDGVRYIGAGDHVAVFAFSQGQPKDFFKAEGTFLTDHNKVINDGINKIDTKGNFYTGLFDVIKLSVESTAGVPGFRRRAVLVFSDGWDSISGSKIEKVVQQARDEHVMLFTVGLGPNMAPDKEQSQFLRFLAENTEGKYHWFRPGSKGGQEAMNQFLKTISDYRNMYEVTYESEQYKGEPEVRVAVKLQGREASGSRGFDVPVLPPKVKIESPKALEPLHGEVEVRAAPYELQREVERIEFYLDGELLHTAYQEPYNFTLDTTVYATDYQAPTAHELRAKLYDMAGQTGEDSIMIGLLASTPTPPPTSTPIPPTPLPTWTPYPTPTPMPPPKTSPFPTMLALFSLAIAIAAVVLVIVMIRRGPPMPVRAFAQEVRRATQVFGRATGIFASGSAPGRQVHATLTVVSDMYKGKEFEITQNVVFVGREDERADIVFHWDNYISRRHAKISRERDEFYIWDLKSSNGTWVDGVRLPRSESEGMDLVEAEQLQDGSEVQFGPDLKVRFYLHDEGDTDYESDEGTEPVSRRTEVMDALGAEEKSPAGAYDRDVEDSEVYPTDTFDVDGGADEDDDLTDEDRWRDMIDG